MLWLARMTFPFPLALTLALVVSAAARAQDLADLDDDDDGAFSGAAAVPVLTDLSPRDTRVLLGDDLVRKGYRTVGEALANEVGFSRERSARGWRYALRGVPAGALLVVDGVPQVVDAERDELDVDLILALADVDRVEIVRGPVTALSGAGGLSGVVRITTKRPGLMGVRARASGAWLAGTHAAPGAEELAAEGTLREGDIGLRMSARVLGGPTQLWRVRAAPTRYQTISGVTIPVTKEERDVALVDEALSFRLSGQWSDVLVDVSAARTLERSPLSSFSHGLVVDDPQTIERGALRGRALWQRWLGALHVEAAAFAARHGRRDDGPLYPTRGIFSDGGQLTVDSDVLTGGGVARVDVPVTDAHRFVLSSFGDVTSLDARGASRDPRSGENVDDTVTLQETTATGAVAAEWQGDLGLGLHATAGAALDFRTAFEPAFAPRIALAWTPAGGALALRASYAEGVRAPDRYDVTALAQTVVDGRAAGAGSNAALRPEHARCLELTTSFSPAPALALDVRAFALRHEDAFVDAVEVQNGAALLVPVNLAPRTLLGGEATGAVSPFGDALALEGGIAAAQTVDGPSVGADLLQATAAVTVAPTDALRFGTRARARARDVDDGSAAAHLDAWLSFSPLSALTIGVSVTNLLDSLELWIDREAPPQADPVRLPSPGRTAQLSVEGRF